jgi:hypothetical protein
MPKHNFYVCKEKEIFKESRQEILNENIVSTSGTNAVDEIQVYDMPPLFDQTKKEKPSEKVSNLRKILGSCVKLLNDENSVRKVSFRGRRGKGRELGPEEEKNKLRIQVECKHKIFQFGEYHTRLRIRSQHFSK